MLRSRAVVIAAFVSVALSASCGARTDLDFDDGVNTANGGDASAEADGAADADAAVACMPGSFTLDKAKPAVMLVLDRSGSMSTRFGATGATRWDVLTDALATSLPPIDQTVALGALAFPDGSSASSCNAPGTPDLLPALGNAGALVSLMRSKGTGGGTPTADAIDIGGKALLGVRAASTARTMVLATDGGPDCNEGLDPRTCRCVESTRCNSAMRCLDDTRTIDRIRTYTVQGIPTYVIGIESAGDTTNSDVLDAMAIAGGREQPTGAHRYYSATSDTELNAALVDIRNQVGACTFLTRSVPGDAGTITVVLDGQIVPFDPGGMTGWNWADRANGEIVFSGDACAKAVSATIAPTANVSCSPPDAGAEGGAEGGASDGGDVDGSDDAAVDVDGS
jgi:hypothetical protein